jgi:hypothetical protein
MPMKLYVESLDAVPAQFRGEYTDIGGRFRLNVEGIEEENEAALSALRVERDALVKQQVETSLTAALSKANASEWGADLLTEHFRGRIKSEPGSDGKRVISILNADGTPMVGSGPNGFATIADLMQEAVGQYPSLFQENAGHSQGNTITRADFELLRPVEQSAKIKAGIKVVDVTLGERPDPKPTGFGPKIITRKDFDALGPIERAAKVKAGVKIVDTLRQSVSSAI